MTVFVRVKEWLQDTEETWRLKSHFHRPSFDKLVSCWGMRACEFNSVPAKTQNIPSQSLAEEREQVSSSQSLACSPNIHSPLHPKGPHFILTQSVISISSSMTQQSPLVYFLPAAILVSKLAFYTQSTIMVTSGRLLGWSWSDLSKTQSRKWNLHRKPAPIVTVPNLRTTPTKMSLTTTESFSRSCIAFVKCALPMSWTSTQQSMSVSQTQRNRKPRQQSHCIMDCLMLLSVLTAQLNSVQHGTRAIRNVHMSSKPSPKFPFETLPLKQYQYASDWRGPFLILSSKIIQHFRGSSSTFSVVIPLALYLHVPSQALKHLRYSQA